MMAPYLVVAAREAPEFGPDLAADIWIEFAAALVCLYCSFKSVFLTLLDPHIHSLTCLLGHVCR
jgi:hypothetical protein